MWPLVLTFLRSNARLAVLPIAAVIGVIGYNIEGTVDSLKISQFEHYFHYYFQLLSIGLLSDKYTPFSKSIEEARRDRTTDALLANADKVEKLGKYENVLGRNLSPSLQPKN